MHDYVPASELQGRMNRFRARMDIDHPEWEMVAIFGKINLYYLTGTIQDGVLLVERDRGAVFWVRRSLERAMEESCFPDIRPMRSFRDAALGTAVRPHRIFMETEVVPLALAERFRKHFPCTEVRSMDLQAARVRSIKSPYELALLEKAGEIHRVVLEEEVPGILKEGMSEAEFGVAVYSLMVERGHQGIVRFGRFNTEIEVGQIGFGESSLYPTCFDGPGGCYGACPGAPVLGSQTRRLRQGDLVFIDNSCGVNGYQTDKTMNYMFGRPVPEEAFEAHRGCMEVLDELVRLLKPGAIPSALYTTIMESIEPGFMEHFMGFGERRASFLGHGTGLVVDEIPVIAMGFDDPLEEGMAIALEPKKGVPGVGLVGLENTYVVTPGGGRSITGRSRGLIPVY
ncbi:MAG TPA: Xaa-Pro peptidase family protein [Methanolinea sp.]|nr:Xaa-Pro peptidase family protein [Methanolinea sp.]HQK56211.1 Xaa-Pro peptidase family protein [Methanolinea sp.]